MKRILIIGLLLAGGWARATVDVSQTFSGGSVSADNPVPTYFTGNFLNSFSSADTVLSLTVSLNVSGDYANAFYAYLIAPNGSQVVLLNNPGVATDPLGIGNTTVGLNLTLQDGATPIDQNVNLANGSTYAAAGSLSTVDGSLAEGNWTLVFADTQSSDLNGYGTVNPTLNSWSLDITIVPEPVNVAMAIFSLLAAVVIVASSLIKIRPSPALSQSRAGNGGLQNQSLPAAEGAGLTGPAKSDPAAS